MTIRRLKVTSVLIGVTLGAPALAQQGDSEAAANVSLSAGTETSTEASADTSAEASAESSVEPEYMDRYRPTPNFFEVGLFGGVFIPSKHHELIDEYAPYQLYRRAAPELGLRVGYFPLSFLGIEAEGAVIPTNTRDGEKAGLWAARAHGVLQLPLASVVPFGLIGGGALGVGSDSLGSDIDPALHFGIGVKVPLDEFLSLRLDLRDNMSQKWAADDGKLTSHPDVLLGLTFTLDPRSEPEPEPEPVVLDRDGDGFEDSKDACPDEPGVAPDGCPLPPDRDGDGVPDADDRCPDEAGPAPEGCPPPADSDGDGFLDPDDDCPNTPGIAPRGCPDTDPDKDGIVGDADKCPDEPETKNGFQDKDGCPDELPAEVKKFTGVIQGIEFDFGKATIRPGSRGVLNAAAKTLKNYPDLRVRITGHTDNVGQLERNMTLSRERADSVKQYLSDQGVDASRIETRGAGPQEPVADNNTAAGRQENRRIEFNIITE
jgi:OOP family OmpA-OmpF porin